MLQMFFALSPSELGVSEFTINSILFLAAALLLALPLIFLSRQGKGKEAF